MIYKMEKSTSELYPVPLEKMNLYSTNFYKFKTIRYGDENISGNIVINTDLMTLLTTIYKPHYNVLTNRTLGFNRNTLKEYVCLEPTCEYICKLSNNIEDDRNYFIYSTPCIKSMSKEEALNTFRVDINVISSMFLGKLDEIELNIDNIYNTEKDIEEINIEGNGLYYENATTEWSEIDTYEHSGGYFGVFYIDDKLSLIYQDATDYSQANSYLLKLIMKINEGEIKNVNDISVFDLNESGIELPDMYLCNDEFILLKYIYLFIRDIETKCPKAKEYVDELINSLLGTTIQIIDNYMSISKNEEINIINLKTTDKKTLVLAMNRMTKYTHPLPNNLLYYNEFEHDNEYISERRIGNTIYSIKKSNVLGGKETSFNIYEVKDKKYFSFGGYYYYTIKDETNYYVSCREPFFHEYVNAKSYKPTSIFIFY